jgi:hypothetical protein
MFVIIQLQTTRVYVGYVSNNLLPCHISSILLAFTVEM